MLPKTNYAGSIRCGKTPPNKGSAVASAIAESVIDWIDLSKCTWILRYIFSKRGEYLEIEGPTAVTLEGESHFLSVVRCEFTANA